MSKSSGASPRPQPAVTTPKSYFIKTFGCQMNVYDSERMEGLLEGLGMQAAPDAEHAELVVLNTCHIREKAAEKVYSDIGRLKANKRANGIKPMVAVTGCVAQAEGAEILARAPTVDVVVGPQAYHRLPEMIAAAASARTVDTDMPEVSKFVALPKRRKAQGPSAFLTVQEGCDKFCTFCVVPYTRGSEVSRPAADVLAEARALAEEGVREIILLGQNVNAYHGALEGGSANSLSLGALIREIAAMPGIARIRYTTSHPRDMDAELMAAHRDVPQLMPYLHLPVQSGSTRILKAMNRAHTRESYIATVQELRALRPDLALSGDFIVGFPGESEEDFEDTLSLIRQVRYAAAFSFKYSPRPGTPAASLGEQISEEVKTDRLARLQALIAEQSLAFNQQMVGQSMDVLLERKGRRPGQLIGKSPWLQSVHLVCEGAEVGDMVRCEIVRALPNSLEGINAQRIAV